MIRSEIIPSRIAPEPRDTTFRAGLASCLVHGVLICVLMASSLLYRQLPIIAAAPPEMKLTLIPPPEPVPPPIPIVPAPPVEVPAPPPAKPKITHDTAKLKSAHKKLAAATTHHAEKPKPPSVPTTPLPVAKSVMPKVPPKAIPVAPPVPIPKSTPSKPVAKALPVLPPIVQPVPTRTPPRAVQVVLPAAPKPAAPPKPAPMVVQTLPAMPPPRATEVIVPTLPAMPPPRAVVVAPPAPKPIPTLPAMPPPRAEEVAPPSPPPVPALPAMPPPRAVAVVTPAPEAIPVEVPAAAVAAPAVAPSSVAATTNAPSQGPLPDLVLSPVMALVNGPDKTSFPQPNYPYEARSRGLTGTVGMRVQFDGRGGVTQDDVIDSSGVKMLDAATKEFIRKHWHLPEFAGRAVRVSIVYQMTTP